MQIENEKPVIPKPALKILIAEDNLINQNLVATILRIAGYELTLAQSGEEAVELEATNEFDLILMDIDMPGMGGVEAATRIIARRTASNPIPIIALTAHAMPADRERFLRIGMVGYVAKPFERVELLRAIDEALKRI